MHDVERLFRLYHDPLVRYLTRRLGDRDWAEEVAQETFLRALRQEGPLSSERAEPTVKWVTIAIACSATDTPIATLMADTSRAGAIDSGGMRAGGSAPATESRAVRGLPATFPPGAGGAIAAPCAGGAPARTATSAGAAG